MDAQRSLFTLTIAALFAGTALAAPPSQSASDWSSAGVATAPTITASPNNRYSYPQAGRTSNTVNTAAPQSYGATGNQSQTTYPFAVQPAAPPTSAATRNNPAPPPWPTTSSTPAPPPTSNWGSSIPATPVDRSLLTNAPPTGEWSSIGSTIAAPPMLLPQSPGATESLAPLSSTSSPTSSSFDNGPSFTTDSYRGTPPSFGSSANSAPQSSNSSPSRTAPADNWASGWDGSASNNTATAGNSAPSIGNNNTSRSGASHAPDFPNSPRIAANQQDTRTTAAKPADSWADDGWGRNSPSNKPVAIGSASNFPPAIQAPANSPQVGPPPFGTAGNNNVSSNGTNPFAAQQQQQQSAGVNGTKPLQTPGGEPQPWVTLLAAILGLAGSLAGNVYLGWSYLDARQKYQALVRRTADTFRRTKVAA